jgi:hypothetical protein
MTFLIFALSQNGARRNDDTFINDRLQTAYVSFIIISCIYNTILYCKYKTMNIIIIIIIIIIAISNNSNSDDNRNLSYGAQNEVKITFAIKL